MTQVTNQARTPPAPADGQAADSLPRALAGLLIRPVPTLRELVTRRPLAWALLVTIVLCMGIAVAQWAVVTPASYDVDPFSPGPEASNPYRTSSLIGALAFGPTLGLIALATAAGLLQIASSLLRGRGPYLGLLVGLAFAALPSFFAIPFNLIPLGIESSGQPYLGIVNGALFVWVLALVTIVIRENNGFSLARAATALGATLLAVTAVLWAIAEALAALLRSTFT